jgi:hypothetical protein
MSYENDNEPNKVQNKVLGISQANLPIVFTDLALTKMRITKT